MSPRTITEFIEHTPGLLETSIQQLCSHQFNWERTERPLKHGTSFYLRIEPVWQGTTPQTRRGNLTNVSRGSVGDDFAASFTPGTVQVRWQKDHTRQLGQWDRDKALERFLRKLGWVPDDSPLTRWRPPASYCQACPHLLARTLEGVVAHA
jgi:hypothetical protein